MASPKIVVLSSGVMSCLYGGMLGMAGYGFMLIDIRKEHTDSINSRGLTIENRSGERIVRKVKAVSEACDAGEASLVMFFVKARQPRRR